MNAWAACWSWGPTDEASQKAFSQVKSAIRANYSNPPSHGGAIVATILSDPALRTQWLGQLDSIRGRIQGMRRLFAQKMAEHGSKIDYSFIMGQNGMFSLSGLSREQVEQFARPVRDLSGRLGPTQRRGHE